MKFRQSALLMGLLIGLKLLVVVKSDSEVTAHTHCLSSDEDLLISDPWPSISNTTEGFIAMEWSFKGFNSENWGRLVMAEANDEDIGIASEGKRASFYDGWGLRLSNITLKDSGIYKALLNLTSHDITNGEKFVIVTAAKPPILSSVQLSVTSSVKEGGDTITLSCGTLESFGQPATYPQWKDENGTIFNSTSQVGGDFYLKLSGPVDQQRKWSCGMDFEAPAAYCIPEADRNRWEYKLEEPGDESINESSDGSGDGSGDESGDGSSDGSGDGSGNWSGDGSGDGYGNGSGDGSDDRSSDGSGDGSIDGSIDWSSNESGDDSRKEPSNTVESNDGKITMGVGITLLVSAIGLISIAVVTFMAINKFKAEKALTEAAQKKWRATQKEVIKKVDVSQDYADDLDDSSTLSDSSQSSK